ncbi:hypothetical protein VTN77DRAFT_2017 [Rasamsonia byssochlamydoides]|uniref:uncharacterized protein n=1 Tax=Rasamsonia byssochlamydoides TaxID=89139 RepID=UPI0037447753
MAASSQPVFTMDSPCQQYADEWADFETFFNFHAYDMDGSLDNQTDSMGCLFPQDQSLSTECLDLPDMQFCGPAFEPFPVQNAPMDDSFTDPNLLFSSTQTSQTLDYRIADVHSYQNMDFTLSPFAEAGSEPFSQETSAAIRDLVHVRATADPRCASMKEKRRDAAIALHLQRLSEANLYDAGPVSDSKMENLSSPGGNFYSGSVSPQSSQGSLPGLSRTASTYSVTTPASAFSSGEQQPSQSTVGGVEMVLDLNMNAATRLPKKQKPRTKAQIESYINVRRNGACEKHRKQHKKCNCLDKLATGTSPDAKVRKPLGISRTASDQTVQYVQQKEFVPTPANTSKTWRVSSPRYICLMPGCTYSSRTVSSLQRHYVRHSMPSSGALYTAGDIVWPPINPHLNERPSTRPAIASSLVTPPERALATSPVAGNTALARAAPAVSVQESSGTLATQQPRQEGLAKEWRKRQSRASSPYSSFGYPVETLLEFQQNFTSASAQVALEAYLFFASGVSRFLLHFATAVFSWLQSYSRIVAIVATIATLHLHEYDGLSRGFVGMGSAEKFMLISL